MMSHASLPDLLTMIQAARHTRGADRERHLERAENTCRAILAATGRRGFCKRDGEPCAPECTYSLAINGRCGREGT